MRGPDTTAMAVRNAKGEIILEKWDTPPPSKTKNIPILRGVVALGTSLKVGYRCLMRSGEIAGLDQLEEIEEFEGEPIITEDTADSVLEEAEEAELAQSTSELAIIDCHPQDSEEVAPDPLSPSDEPLKSEPSKKDTIIMSIVMVIAAIFGVGLAVVLFMFLPQVLFNIPANIFGWHETVYGEIVPLINPALYRFTRSAIVGIIRITLFVAYMAATSLMKDIRRTFMYHGAEHKAIYCYEKGLPLTVENVKAQPRLHPRCGTSFLIFMLLIGIFVGFFVPAHFGPLARMGTNFLILPLVVGLGYETIRLAGKKRDTAIMKILSAPGMWLQRISTREPTDDMLEVAIKSLVEVLPQDREAVECVTACPPQPEEKP